MQLNKVRDLLNALKRKFMQLCLPLSTPLDVSITNYASFISAIGLHDFSNTLYFKTLRHYNVRMNSEVLIFSRYDHYKIHKH